MKKLLLLLLCVPMIGSGQTDEEGRNVKEPFIIVEDMPMLGDCKDEKSKYKREECTAREIMLHIKNNFKYPEISKANGIEGTVVVQFVVEKDGSITDISILKGICDPIDKEYEFL